ncbi:MAG: sigma-70 family RNA polymerase sigma factor [Betaproteobacteria bacterium]|nr:sigma-70 family RNA polymerase sigma factor [Betaproteobacteria bacterium]
MELEEHLFRREAGRLVAIVARLFGLQNLALAEDVVQEAFCRALETWKFHGVPENPSAWLMATAKHRALDALRREGTARRLAPELQRELESEWTLAPTVEEAFDRGLDDAQLRMMFSCIHPRLPEETQVALVLHLVCGFGIDETAAAFLKSPAAMEKRIARAKRILAESKQLFDLSADDVAMRLPAVLRAVYLLFNEGYHGASAESSVRIELCREAMRLARLLVEHPRTARPATHAIAALLHFHAARLPGRTNGAGELLVLDEQDPSLWDRALVAEGYCQLDLSATGSELTSYHVEAAIAAHHARRISGGETDWEAVVQLYDTLMELAPSPIVALNRAVALAQRDGPARGLDAIWEIEGRSRLDRYPFLHSAIAEFELQLGRPRQARQAFNEALRLARNPMERRFVEKRLESLKAA